jgi:hypothetical protein
MRRREFIAGLGSTAAWPLAAWAQQAAMPVIGWLDLQSPEAARESVPAFQQGLWRRPATLRAATSLSSIVGPKTISTGCQRLQRISSADGRP